MLPLLAQVMLEFGALKGSVILRVWWHSPPVKSPELLPPTTTYRLHQGRIEMTDEEGKWSGLTIFLPHEQEGEAGGQQHHPRRHLERLKGDKLTQAFAQHTVAHLIVVLRTDDKLMGWDVARRVAIAALAEGRILAGRDVALRQGVSKMGHGPKVLIVPKPLC